MEELIKSLVPVRSQETIYEDDYRRGSDGLLMCGVCGMPKEQLLQLPSELYQATINCKCEQDEFDKKKEQERTAKYKANVERLKERGLRSKMDLDKTFKHDDSPDSTASKVARFYAENFEEMLETNTGLYFSGPVGTGKTFYALCIANAVAEKERSIWVTSLTELVNAMQGFEEEERRNILKRVRSVDLLILDDVGVERSTDFVNEQVQLIVDTRYQSNKPLIVASNLTPEDLANTTNANERRSADRINEMASYEIQVKGNSRRADMAKSKKKDFYKNFIERMGKE